MYRFTDVTEKGSTMLPSEALRINGKYIEELVKGYKTLNVKGREILLADIDEYSTGGADGTSMRRRKYPARVITVTFQLIAETNEQYRRAFEKLNAVLNVEDAQLIFDDEKDRYYIGTPSSCEDVEPGRNAVVGKFSIKCFDPFKYALTEKVLTANKDKVFEFNYDGTYPAHPHFEVSLPESSCGYMAFVNQDGKIIQLGNPSEIDGIALPPSERLIDISRYTNPFKASEWKINEKNLPSLHGMVAIDGTLDTVADKVQAKTYGNGTKFHGPSITRMVKADKSGHVGAMNFRCTFSHKFCLSKDIINQQGAFNVLFCHNTGTERHLVTAFSIETYEAPRIALTRMFEGDVGISTYGPDVPIDWDNLKTGASENASNTCTVTKVGEVVTFNIYGTKKSITIRDRDNREVNEISIVFAAYGNKPVLGLNMLYDLTFTKDHTTTFIDIPNKFSQGDNIKVNGDEGRIIVNNLETPEYGAIGNDWEGFKLTQGANRINVAMSDWTKNAQIKLKYRERYI